MKSGKGPWERGASPDRMRFFPFPCICISLMPSLSSQGKNSSGREIKLFLELLFHKERCWVSLNTSHMVVPHNKEFNCISFHSPHKDGFMSVQKWHLWERGEGIVLRNVWLHPRSVRPAGRPEPPEEWAPTGFALFMVFVFLDSRGPKEKDPSLEGCFFFQHWLEDKCHKIN